MIVRHKHCEILQICSADASLGTFDGIRCLVEGTLNIQANSDLEHSGIKYVISSA